MGLIPRTVEKLFQELSKNDIIGEIKISYLEIYN